MLFISFKNRLLLFISMPRKKKTEEEKIEEVKEEKPKKTKAKKETKETEENKEEKAEKKAGNLLVPVEDYIKYSSYLGTKVITKHMRQYVYKRRADGLAIFNTELLDKQLRDSVEFMAKYGPKDIVLCCKREAGWNAAEMFSKITGIRTFTKKYPAGILTNIKLPEFFETKLMFVIDPWIDKNPLKDAIHVRIPVVSLCDTNNVTLNVNHIIPCNNKSNKSIGLILWIIAREYCKARGIEAEMPSINDFVGEIV